MVRGIPHDPAASFAAKEGTFTNTERRFQRVRRGKVRVRAQVTDIGPPGVCSMTFHFHESRTNDFTNPALDPVAKIPETNATAVRVANIG